MALLINEDCVNCGVCEPECPNEAISEGEDFYEIDADLWLIEVVSKDFDLHDLFLNQGL